MKQIIKALSVFSLLTFSAYAENVKIEKIKGTIALPDGLHKIKDFEDKKIIYVYKKDGFSQMVVTDFNDEEYAKMIEHINE